MLFISMLLLLLLLQEDEDDDLQRAIKASLLTAAQEGHPGDPTSSQQPTQPQQQQDMSMPQWMSAGSTLGAGAGAGAECSTPPSTPKSQGFAPLPALLQPHRQDLDDQLHSWVPVGDAAEQQQQQPAGSGGLSGGAAGLFDGLAFSEERPAAPRPQGDRCMPAGTPFAGLQRIRHHAGSSGTLAPGSPARVEQPQPARGRNVSNSSGAGGPFAGQLHKAAGGVAGAAGSNVSSLLDGLDSMTEEQQLKRAMELSLLESAAGNAAADDEEDADAAAAGLAGLVNKDGYDEEAALQKALEESAAAAEMQLLQQQAQNAEVAAGKQPGSEEAGDVEQPQQGAATGSDAAAAAAAGGGDGSGDDDDDAVVVAENGAGGNTAQQQQQQQQRQRLPLVSSSTCNQVLVEFWMVWHGACIVPLLACVLCTGVLVAVLRGARAGALCTSQCTAVLYRQRLDPARVVIASSPHRRKHTLPCCYWQVWLVEDSDCEDEDGKAAPSACDTTTPAAAAVAGDDPDSMQVDPAEQLPTAAAAARNHQLLGKENQDEQQQHGAAATCSKSKRRPLGEVLCSRDAARANSSRGSILATADAADAPVKQPNQAAAVAASEAAAAASSGGGDQTGELEAVHAAAAAQAAGAWPQQSAALYQLRAVVRHKGPLASSGHFVSEVLSDQQVGADGVQTAGCTRARFAADLPNLLVSHA
jgi:hypothetical protein